MTATTLSKKAIAAAVYVQMTTEGKRRKDIVFTMCEKAGLTEAGASTYYNNFRTGVWKIATPTAVAGAVAPVAVVIETPVAAPVAEVVTPVEAPVEVTASSVIATTEDGGDIFGAVVHAHLAGLGVISTEDEAPAEEVVAEVVVEAPAEEVAVVNEVVAVDYSVMSKAQLVALYNTKSDKPVKDFRNHETAVRRVTELFAG